MAAPKKKATKAAIAAKERATKLTGGGKKHANAFLEFLRTQGVVGLAVGLAIGMQATQTVESIVNGLVNPVVAFIVGSQEGLQAATWVLIEDWNGRTLELGWGAVLSALITLTAVAALIYWVVNGLRLDRLDKKKD